MAKYIVTYDLRRDRDYQRLYDALENLQAVRLLQSVWLLSNQAGSQPILEHLKNAADFDDGLAVIELATNKNWTTLRVPQSAVDWLRVHLAD